MQYSLIQQDGNKQPLEISDAIFNCSFNETLVHQVICAYEASLRQGTHAQKTRSDVSGGGKKPWRQKGTGRARAGSIRSPLWRGGGATFAVKPRDYSQKINKKMYRGAMRSILSGLIASERLMIIDDMVVAEPKTRILLNHLKKLAATKAIIIINEVNISLYLAARNLPHVKLCLATNINLTDLMRYQKTIITLPALKMLEENLL